MKKPYTIFLRIQEEMVAEYASVSPGIMMSSPAIRYKTKVFAFYHNNEMIFRMGKDFDPSIFKLKKYSILNPFKKKAPLYGWFQVSISEGKKWKKLAIYAYDKIVKESS
jgi:hypothetical protein